MRAAKAGITGLTPTEVVAKSLLVETKLTGNPHFVPEPTIAALTAQRAVVEAAIVDSAGGDHAKVYARNVEVAKLKAMLVAEAHTVTAQAQGDVVKILSSGFEARKLPEPFGPLPAPEAVEARTGDKPGEIKVQCGPVKGAHYYHWYINSENPDDQALWQLFSVGSKASFVASGLRPGGRYWFSVEAQGPLGAGPLSDPAKGYAGNEA